MRRYFNNGTSLQDVVKDGGKLTTGGNVVGTFKDIRDRKSILNKKTETKEEKRKRFNKKAMPPFDLKKRGDKLRPKRLDELPIGKPKRLDELPIGKPKLLNKGGRVGLKRGTFPDLNKDGKITKADILMGRGVIPKKKNKKMMAKKKSPRKKAMGLA